MSRIFVCGITRNSRGKFIHNYRRLRSHLEPNHDLYWYFYENDSKDKTPALLAELADEDPRFHYDSEILGLTDWGAVTKPARVQQLCWCRNKYMDKLAELNYDFDHMLVVDMDLSNIERVGAIETAISMDADMVGANGRMKSGDKGHTIYYDCWALQGCNLARCHNMKINTDPIGVKACFGGMGLYKVTSVEGLRYRDKETEFPNADHGTLHDAMRKRGHTRMFILPSWRIWR